MKVLAGALLMSILAFSALTAIGLTFCKQAFQTDDHHSFVDAHTVAEEMEEKITEGFDINCGRHKK